MNILVDLFAPKHIMGLQFVVVWVIILFVVMSLLKIKEKQFALIFTIVFFVLEIVKISFMWYRGGFPMNHLPFHLCSMPLYLFPVYYFSKAGSKLEDFARAGIYGVVFMSGLIALIIPTNIIGDVETWILVEDNFLPYISFIYHGTMIFVSLYILIKGFYKFKYSDVLKAFSCALVLMVFAVIANALLDKDFMLLNRGSGSPFQFLIETSQLLYTFSMVFLGFFIIHLNFGVTKLIYIIIGKK
jgi:hypothetical protein